MRAITFPCLRIFPQTLGLLAHNLFLLNLAITQCDFKFLRRSCPAHPSLLSFSCRRLAYNSVASPWSLSLDFPTTITSLKSQIPLLEHNGLDYHSLTNRNPLFNFFQNLGTFDSSTISEFLASFWPHFLPPSPAWTPHKPLSLLLLSYLGPPSSHQTPIPPSVWIFC